jgi:Zn-dependent protease with chaperone function
MIAALKRLQSLSQLRADTPVSTPDNLRAFMIHAPDSVFSTHPSLDNRIAALEKNYQLH